MKRFIVLTLLLLPATMAAQRPPDNDEILRAIVDSDSPYYYPSLFLRYEAGDTTLTLEDYHYLYYGYAYQESYKPLEPIPGEAEMMMLLERSPEPNASEAADIIKYAREIMRSDPFSPKNINFMAYAYTVMGDTIQAAVNFDRLTKILATIKSTGTGLKENSPWHVLWFSHATDIIGTMDLKIQGRIVRTRSVEYVEVLRKSKGDPKGYFFDFGRMYWKRPQGPPRQKKNQGFMINYQPVGKNRNQQTPAR